MAKKPENHDAAWTEKHMQRLEHLVDRNTPTRLIALKLGRTEYAVRTKASELGISLKPVNQSPYGRQKK